MFGDMKTMILAMVALTLTACCEEIEPSEPEPGCVIPEGSWSYDGDRIVCDENATEGDGTTCYWEGTSFAGVCGTWLSVHVAFGVADVAIAYDDRESPSQCHWYPGVDEDSQPHLDASDAD